MVEMNAQEALKQLNAPSDIEVEHSDIMTASQRWLTCLFCGRDLAENAERLGTS